MFPIRVLGTSEEAYASLRVLLDLHTGGVGLREAIQALEPIAEAMWRTHFDDDWDWTAKACLLADPSTHVTCQCDGGDGDFANMIARISRPGEFSIVLWWRGYDEGEFIPFSDDDSDTLVAFEAQNTDALVRFLTLSRLIGGELDFTPYESCRGLPLHPEGFWPLTLPESNNHG